MVVVMNIFCGKNFLKIFLLLFFFSQLTIKTFGQIVVEEEQKRYYYERLRRIDNFWDMRDMRDVTHKDRFLMGKKRISGSTSFNTQRIIINDGKEDKEEYRNALGFFTRIRFFEEFSFNTTFYLDFNPRAAARWTSNYTYSIARYAWKPGKFNYGYENYINNRYKDNLREMGNKFLEGYYFLSFSHKLPEMKINKLIFDESSGIRINYFARYAIKYREPDNSIHGGLDNGKWILGSGFRYTIIKNIYLEATIYYYPEEYKKQPWDPDFTYGFGYFDWRAFRISASYGNWAVNRLPWNTNFYDHYGFLDGNFKISANWAW
jgi:hypothetical protein